MWTKAFWKSVAERSVSTFVQAFLAAVAVYGTSVGFEDVDWLRVASLSGVAFVLSVAKNVLVALGSDGNPSVGSVEELKPEA